MSFKQVKMTAYAMGENLYDFIDTNSLLIDFW